MKYLEAQASKQNRAVIEDKMLPGPSDDKRASTTEAERDDALRPRRRAKAKAEPVAPPAEETERTEQTRLTDTETAENADSEGSEL